MAKITYNYPAFRIFQTPKSKPLVLLAAPAVEISKWAGIPQRGRLAGGETVGFQREENKTRVRELSRFFVNAKNVVQNPLLCATQSDVDVQFIPDPGNDFGTLRIETDDLDALSLRDLISRVVERLETRVPALIGQPIEQERRAHVYGVAKEVHSLTVELEDDGSDESEDEGTGNTDDGALDAGSVLLSDETQILDFYQELRIRREILDSLAADQNIDDLVGFTKEAMKSYLQPVVLVDGQHRLRGAVASAEQFANSVDGKAAQREAVDKDADPAAAYAKVVTENSRVLPISLLLDDSPSEHVFQFVVVNQKATPMGNALLGTIVTDWSTR